MNANDMRPGMVIRHNGELFTIHKAEHRTPGNLRAFVQARMRNLRTGALIDHRFRSEDTIEKANLDEVDMQYLYSDGDSYFFMNTQNYEQIGLHKSVIEDRASYLVPEVVIKVQLFEGRPPPPTSRNWPSSKPASPYRSRRSSAKAKSSPWTLQKESTSNAPAAKFSAS